MPSAASRARERGVTLPSPTNRRAPLRVEQQVRQEHRVVFDVAAAQVGEPGDVVDGRDEVVRRAVPRHRFAHARQLGGARLDACGASCAYTAAGRQRGAIGPDLVQHVGSVRSVMPASSSAAAQRLRRRQAEHLAVDRDDAGRAAASRTSQSMW